MALHNWLFPSTAVRLEGLMKVDHHLQPVISQCHIASERGATREEVAAEMRLLGFEPIPARPDDYMNWSIGVEVTDLHGENVVVGAGGVLFFIDPIPMMDEASKMRRLQEEG